MNPSVLITLIGFSAVENAELGLNDCGSSQMPARLLGVIF
jgi:hypothetical protein